MVEVSLTKKNLAIIGALDEFYDLYCEIKNIYETHRKQYLREDTKKFPLLSRTWDDLCIKDVRKRFEPLLNKYLYLFTSGYDRIYANAYAFQEFSFIDKEKSVAKFNGEGPFILSYKSFSDFLVEVMIIITVLDHRYNYINDNKSTIQQSWTRINENIERIVEVNIAKCEGVDIDCEEDTKEILYIFDKLSSTSCYKNEHPVVAARYVAVVAKTGKKISLPVHFCDYCKKYFIGAKTLSVFEKYFGKLVIEKRDISEMEFKFGCFSAESKLHSLGYNVVRGNMTDEERKQLLVYLLENKMIKYVELCATIEQNISIFKNSYRHKLAVEKWRTDLKSIGEYILKNSEKKNDEGYRYV